MPPWADEELLLKNNYAHADGRASSTKLEAYIQIYANELRDWRELSKCNSTEFSDREVYVVRGREPLVLNDRQHSFYLSQSRPQERQHDKKKPYVLEIERVEMAIAQQKEELRQKERELNQLKAAVGLEGAKKQRRLPKRKRTGSNGAVRTKKKGAPPTPTPTTVPKSGAGGQKAPAGLVAKAKGKSKVGGCAAAKQKRTRTRKSKKQLEADSA